MNWWSPISKFRKKLTIKLPLMLISESRSKGDFDQEVAAKATSQGLIMESILLEKALKLLEKDDEVITIMGIFGMGGVGKTTLLYQIKNKFHDFDAVAWVVVSQELDLLKIQKEIGRSLGLKWEEEEEDHHGLMNSRAEILCGILSNKKFALLLDDCWERVDLKRIGIPLDPKLMAASKRIKVVITTRFEGICKEMKAQRIIEVESLNQGKAWKLSDNEEVDEIGVSGAPEPAMPAMDKECCCTSRQVTKKWNKTQKQ